MPEVAQLAFAGFVTRKESASFAPATEPSPSFFGLRAAVYLLPRMRNAVDKKYPIGDWNDG